ncbi:MAG TPA: SRPBCC family protein [Pyrinomonadaceae bacterium]|nr:SRPBCC family protein [Pyrinomonadaceae bacterium]
MKILLVSAAIVVAVLVIGIAVVLIIGYRLPKNHTASRTVRLNRPVKEVYSKVRNVEDHPKWRPDVKSIEILPPDEDGRTRFREVGSNGAVTYEITEDVPDRQIVTTILDRDLGYSGSWTYTFEEKGETTDLTITENGEVSNLLFRFMSRYVFGHGATIDSYLKALSKMEN